MMIGFMLNCILPLRAGEFARPAVLMKNSKVPYTAGLATLVAERLFDIIIMILLFVLTDGWNLILQGLLVSFR